MNSKISLPNSHILGYPRIGAQRELKWALEQYWRGDIDQHQLKKVGSDLRHQHWQDQKEAGLSFVTVGDFAWYDQVLNTSMLLGHIPARHQQGFPDLDALFRVARGQAPSGCSCAAADMTKWFNTNYHYIVPEFSEDDRFTVAWTQLFEEIVEAQKADHKVKPVLLGPLSYLWLGKSDDDTAWNRFSLLPRLQAAYQSVLQRLADLDIEWVQIDEPILVLDLPEEWQRAFKLTYQVIKNKSKVLLTTYFESIETYWPWIQSLNVDGIHIDVSVAPQQLDPIIDDLPDNWVLSIGAINGRNVWRADLAHWLERLQPIYEHLNERLWIGSSCSLLHVPVDLNMESELPDNVRTRFAFAHQKLSEISLLAKGIQGDTVNLQRCYEYTLTSNNWSEPASSVASRVTTFTHITDTDVDRSLPFIDRAQLQKNALGLPLLPTTTIGSFPQTEQLRQWRKAWRLGDITESAYVEHMKEYIADTISRQEQIGLDVLVHGEPERNDMVEYFTSALDGFMNTQLGWVQSYGSRCVKPAIVVADIHRSQPITVEWTRYAQSLTHKPVKGMLTGPTTILAWTFPREDVSKEVMAHQIAIALKEEVADLQQSGIRVIQIDEPAIRELLPLKQDQQAAYLNWAVKAFKLSASSAKPETQIHTHMCYSEFNDIFSSVAALDADVITIETSRSAMSLLRGFEDFSYPNAIGPGVYDIHSPNVPTVNEIKTLVEKATQWIPIERLWINPDCGLKTRQWTETELALTNMVKAAEVLRTENQSVD